MAFCFLVCHPACQAELDQLRPENERLRQEVERLRQRLKDSQEEATELRDQLGIPKRSQIVPDGKGLQAGNDLGAKAKIAARRSKPGTRVEGDPIDANVVSAAGDSGSEIGQGDSHPSQAVPSIVDGEKLSEAGADINRHAREPAAGGAQEGGGEQQESKKRRKPPPKVEKPTGVFSAPQFSFLAAGDSEEELDQDEARTNSATSLLCVLWELLWLVRMRSIGEHALVAGSTSVRQRPVAAQTAHE